MGGLIGIGSSRGTIKELAQDSETLLKRLESPAGPASRRGFAYNPAAPINPVQAYDAGPYNQLRGRSLTGDGIDLHHAGQADQMERLIPGYSRKNGPSIALPNAEHTKIPNLRGTPSLAPRQLLARDIVNLRKYTNAPNDSLRNLIELNKKMYPGAFGK